MRSPHRTSSRTRAISLGAFLSALACGAGPEPLATDPERPGSPGARWEILDMLREDSERPRHPADGGGRAWLVESVSALRTAPVLKNELGTEVKTDPGIDAGPKLEAITAGTSGRFTIAYEVGPLGIATGGGIFLQVSPFWGWSTPQVEDPHAPGYTEIEVSGDMELSAVTLDQQLLALEVTGRALEAGEKVLITYGAGIWGAEADRYAEKNSRFWIGVDGDGDGTRSYLLDSPGVEILPGPAAQLRVTLPSIARPGETFRITVAVLDSEGSTGGSMTGEVFFDEIPPGLEISGRAVLGAESGGRVTLDAIAREPGVIRLRALGPGGLEAESNPLLVTAAGPQILWGDLHGHSNLSDGTGTAEDYFRYARDVAALDVIALTDHDHWGIPPLDSSPENWAEIRRQVRRFHAPGRFVALLGYEWTSWVHGHRHVLYFEDEGEIYSSVDPAYESPLQLWKALEGKPALTFAHHSAGGPIATNWTIPPDPILEPVTEITSIHGSSEALDSPTVIYDPVPGNFVRDVLDRGVRLGFIGSGDGHDGHPGLTQLGGSPSGLAAILSEGHTRKEVLAALRARRVYATNGPRIILRAALGAHPMGSIVPATEVGISEELFVSVIAVAPLERIDLIRSGHVVDSMEIDGLLEVALQRDVEDLKAGEYLYVRAVQEDGGAAWSSPVFVE